MEELMPDTTGAVLVQVIPAGRPGKIFVYAKSVGPESLSPREMAAVLRSAAELCALQADEDDR